ncbi:methyltransferase domain-containing protein [Paenibacillaceae bacterium]|nr:methyltransferase domain-containing protein [Paenibacillaceae bacterium]
MMINEVAKQLKLSRRTIRFYEAKGLIAPVKNTNNQYRSYTEQDIWRLQTIVTLREIGMPLEEIKKVLGHVEHGNTDELLYYLEIQRSALFSTWLEYKQQMTTTDQMIDILKREQSLPLHQIYKLAEGLKRIRQIRNDWQDRWDFDYQASSHDLVVQANVGLFEHYDQTLDTIYKWIKPHIHEIGLDIGAGTGNLAGRFIASGYQMAAIDQSKEMLKQCQSKFPSLETRLGNFLAIPYLDDHFNFVVSSFALHHLSDEQKILALEEMRRVLKPGGRIALADLMFEDEYAKQRYMQTLDKERDRNLVEMIEQSYVSSLAVISDWLEEKRYMIKQKQVSDILHIIYAVPIH